MPVSNALWLPLAVLILSALTGCVSSTGTVSARDMRPDPSTGLMIAPGSVKANTRIPSFGVAPGNDKTVMGTIAALRPDDVAPIFSRLQVERESAPSGDILSLPLSVGRADDAGTISSASANICQSIGEGFVDVVEQPRSSEGVREILIRCKKP